ncbi:MAG: hypothetical protein JNN30_17730 [Rhodanobacteraceae bacterium]|nr:hypothetical protein [Rhodanobacteraceae bacterium]
MKIPVGLVSLGTALLGSFLFLSGVGGLLMDYVPTVAPEAVAAARDRAYVHLFSGVLVMIVSAGLTGRAAHRASKLSVSSAFVLGASSLFPLCLWLFS